MTSFVKFAVRLFDISHHQDDYDTPYKPIFKLMIDAGFLGVMIRVGWGLVIDRMFAYFWKLAKGALERMPYWYLDYYSHKGKMSAEEWGAEQAEQCWDALKGDPGEMRLALDCEEFGGAWRINYLNRGDYQAVMRGFLKRWKELSGAYPVIYSSPGFMWVFEAWVLELDLWMALYNRNISKERAMEYAREKGWKGRILFWQYTSDGDVNDDGVPDGRQMGFETEALDLNVWMEDSIETFSAYCNGIAIPPVTPPVTEDETNKDVKLDGIVLFSQRDEKWRNDRLGTSASTIGGYGCLITCAASLLCYFGNSIDPGRLNKLLTEKGLYYNGNLFQWDSLDDLFNVKIDWTNFIDCATVPAPLDKIDALLAEKRPVIVKVDFDTNDDDIDQHWVMIFGKRGNDYIILDPWDGKEKTFRGTYGDPLKYIFRIASWRGVVPETPTIPEELPAGTYEVIAVSGLNIRDVPIGQAGSQVIGWMAKGTRVDPIEVVQVESDIWARVDDWKCAAVKYNGVELMR